MILYGVGRIHEDGTIADLDEIKYFKYFTDAEQYLLDTLTKSNCLALTRSPYLTILCWQDGVITKAEYIKYTTKEVNIPVNVKIDEI